MQVAQYTFESPYSSPFQVGRLDPNSLKNNSVNQTFTSQNETEQKAKQIQDSLKQDVTPRVSTNKLDLYA